MPDLTSFRDYVAVQLSIVIFILMIVAGIRSFARQEWGRFVGAILVAVICIGVVVMPAQFESMAKDAVTMVLNKTKTNTNTSTP